MKSNEYEKGPTEIQHDIKLDKEWRRRCEGGHMQRNNDEATHNDFIHIYHI